MGSFTSDLELRIDEGSLLKVFSDLSKAFNKMTEDMAAGVKGADATFKQFAEKTLGEIVQGTTRGGKQLTRQIEAIERQNRALVKRSLDEEEIYYRESYKKRFEGFEAMQKKMDDLAKERFKILRQNQAAEDAATRATRQRALDLEGAIAGKRPGEARVIRMRDQYRDLLGDPATQAQAEANIRRIQQAQEEADRAADQRERERETRAREAQLRAADIRSQMVGKSALDRGLIQDAETVRQFRESGASAKEVDQLANSLLRLREAEQEEGEARKAQDRDAEIRAIKQEAEAIGMTREQLRAMRDEQRLTSLREGGATPAQMREAMQALDNRRIAEANQRFQAEQAARNEVISGYEKEAEMARKTKEEIQQLADAETIRNAKAKGYTDEEVRRIEVAQRTIRTTREQAEATRQQEQMEQRIAAVHERAERSGLNRIQLLQRERDQLIAEAKAAGASAEKIEQLTRDYQKMAVAEEQAQRKSGSVGGLAFRSIRDFFEGRMSYGMVEGTRAAGALFGGSEGLAGIGAGTAAIGGVTVALGALTAAGIASVKSLADLGIETEDVMRRTGLSSKEVGQFAFAAKMAGSEVDVFERMMRGLSQATEEQSASGDKAKKWLLEWGVDIRGVRDGTADTATVMEQVARGLASIENPFERSKAAIDVLKRSGQDAIPVMEDLIENVKKAQELGLGMSPEEQRAAKLYHDQMVEIESAWNLTLLHAKEFFAGMIEWYGHGGAEILKGLKEGAQIRRDSELATSQAYQPPPTPRYPVISERNLTQEAKAREAAEEAVRQKAGDEAVAAYERSLGLQWKLREEERKLQQMQAPEKGVSTAAEVAAYEAEEKRINNIKEQIRLEDKRKEFLTQWPDKVRKAGEAEMDEHDRIIAKWNDEIEKAKELGIAGKQLAGIISDANKARSRDLDQLNIKLDKQYAKEREAFEIEKERTTLRIQLARVPAPQIRELGKGGVTYEDVRSDIEGAYGYSVTQAFREWQQENAIALKTPLGPGGRTEPRDMAQARAAEEERKKIADAETAREKALADLKTRSQDQERAHREEMRKIELSEAEDAIKYEAELEEKRAQLRLKGESPAAGIAASYRIALDTAQKLYEQREAFAQLEEDDFQKQLAHQNALRDLERDRYKAQEEAQLKLAEMQEKQLDTLKGAIEPLYHTLFTDPKNFGKQLRSTITEAALHPITSGLSEITARALYPMIYGATGTGGIAGAANNLFGVKPVNNSLPVWVMNLGGVSGGGPTGPGGLIPWIPGGGGGPTGVWIRPTIPGVSDSDTGGADRMEEGAAPSGGDIFDLPTRGAPIYAPPAIRGGIGGTLSRIFGGTFGGTSGGEVLGASPGYESMQRAAAGPGGLSYAQKLHNLMSQYFGGSPFGKSFGAMGSTFGGYSAALSGGLNTAGTIKALSTGPFANTPAGPAAGMFGGMLASAGIFGEKRGTGWGVAEAAGGGFLAAGPIGGIIGLGIGIGEMAAGVESQRTEAKRLILSLYRINVNNSTADQVVSIANQSYGGRVSVAVRSPEVRHMLGLYAAGTGQSNLYPQLTEQAHGASLVESGGSLYQQATYQYGQAYSYGSNLPIYGGTPTHVLGAPGGSFNVSLNIGGDSAAKFLQGNVVTPDVVQTQYAAAMYGSNGRVQQALLNVEPGTIAG